MKWLADTSVWIEHLRRGDSDITAAPNGAVLHMHPFVVGEVLMGSLHSRHLVSRRLLSLPQLDVEPHAEVLRFVEENALFGRGIGYVDVNLLYRCRKQGCLLMTRDRRLAEAANWLVYEQRGSRCGCRSCRLKVLLCARFLRAGNACPSVPGRAGRQAHFLHQEQDTHRCEPSHSQHRHHRARRPR